MRDYSLKEAEIVYGYEFHKDDVANPKVRELLKNLEANNVVILQPDDSSEQQEFIKHIESLAGNYFSILRKHDNYYVVYNTENNKLYMEP